MRNMSFVLTTPQCRRREKTVTRRQGWWFLKRGDLVQQVEKGQGLKKGEHVKKIHVIRIVSTYGLLIWAVWPEDVVREGFPGKSTAWFVEMYCRHNRVQPNELCNRIAFEYVETERSEECRQDTQQT
jgi:hypothetical protein